MYTMKSVVRMLVCLMASAATTFAGVVIHKDASFSTTVLLENFSGTVDPSTSQTRTSFISATGGAATYNYAAGEGPEGFISYSPLAAGFDPAVYKSLRVRMAVNRDSSATTSVQVFPTPVTPGQFVTETVSSGTTLNESSFDLGSLSMTPSGNGLRLDPFNYVNNGTDDQFTIDYIMADRGRTIGFEFDHDADLNGATLNNVSSSSVMNGVLSGTAGSIDAQIVLSGAGAPVVDADTYKYVEIRMKGAAGDRIDFFWNTAAKGSIPPPEAVDASADGDWHTYTLDFTDEANWTGDLSFLRLDPNVTSGAEFEVDYIRFMEAIPEPATLGMIAAMGLGGLFIRRRFMV